MSLRRAFAERVLGIPPPVDLSKITRIEGGSGITRFPDFDNNMGGCATVRYILKKQDAGAWSLVRHFGTNRMDKDDTNIIAENLSLEAGVAALREKTNGLKKAYGSFFFDPERFFKETRGVESLKAVEYALMQKAFVPLPFKQRIIP